MLNVSDYPWWRSIASFPNDEENIRTYYRDRVEDDEVENASNILLSVHKPEFQRCPEPDALLKEWLEPGWDNYRDEAKTKEFILRPFDQTEFQPKLWRIFRDASVRRTELIKNFFLTTQNG